MLKKIIGGLTSRHPISLLLVAYATGAATTLAFAPYNYWLIYPLALAFALGRMPQTNTKAVFQYWLSFGFGAFSIGISWVHVSMDHFGGLPFWLAIFLMALLALYLAIYPAIAGTLLYKLGAKESNAWRNLILFPALWTLTEWLRGYLLTGFPWLWAGYSQANGPLRLLAAIIGTLGISFLLALIAGAILLACQKQRKPLWIILAIVCFAVLCVPAMNRLQPLGKSVKVALVQGNIPQSLKWQPSHLFPTLDKYLALSKPYLNSDIVIWPEAAVPAPENIVKNFLIQADQEANYRDAAIITGIISFQQGEFFNSVIVLGNHFGKKQHTGDYQDNKDNEYRKHHLLPIGEFVPFGDLLRPLAPLFNLPMSSFARGAYQQPNLSALGYHLATAVCYEIAFPEQVRSNVNNDTDMLLTLSNDAWFGKSNGPLQHMQIAQMRAIELGRPLLRATNNGVTAIVDYQGRIIDQLPQFTEGVVQAEVPLVRGMTWFNKFGQWPILIISACLLVLGVARRLTLGRKNTV